MSNIRIRNSELRIWLIQRAEPTPHDHGEQRALRTGLIARALACRGHEVVWWTSAFDHTNKSFREKYSVRKSTQQGYQIHYLKTIGYKSNISFSRWRDNRVLSRELAREMNKQKIIPDLIFISMPSVELGMAAMTFANKNDIPFVLDVRDLYPDVFEDLVPKWLKPIVSLLSIPMKHRLRILCSEATSIIGITSEFVNWATNYAGRTRRKTDAVFHMAYESSNEAIENDEGFWMSRSLRNKPECLHVIFLGTFTNSFDFQPIFLAARLLQEANAKVYFTFCGTGSKSESVQYNCDKLQNCDFAGWINAPQIRTALKLADIGLAPYIESTNFLKNMPNKPAEYMSSGLGVMTSLSSGPLIDLLLHTGAGARYFDGHDLSEKLKALSSDKSRLKLMRTSALKVYEEHFNASKVYSDLGEFLEKIAYEKKTQTHSTISSL